MPFGMRFFDTLYPIKLKPIRGDYTAAEKEGRNLETRIAMLAIIIEEKESVPAVNDLLFDYRDFIIGRMGMPYRDRELSIISIVLDAPNSAISALSGKIGMLQGVSAKAVYSKK